MLRDSFTETSGAAGGEWRKALPSMNEWTFYRVRKVLISGGSVRENDKGTRVYLTDKGRRDA